MHKTDLIPLLVAALFIGDEFPESTTPQDARELLGGLEGAMDLIASCDDKLEIAAVFFAVGLSIGGPVPVEEWMFRKPPEAGEGVPVSPDEPAEAPGGATAGMGKV